MATAGEHVLSTPELTEMILLRLPMKDLLLAQRVCKSWQQLIVNSPDLQRALFLKPAQEGTVCWVDLYDRDCELVQQNPELLRQYNSDFTTDGPDAHFGKNADDNDHYLIFRNPLIDSKLRFMIKLADDGNTYKRHLSSKKLAALVDLPAALARPEASWRKMLYSQPAISSLSLWYDGASGTEMLHENREGRGITIGDVFDIAVELGGLCSIQEDMMGKWWTGRDLRRISAPRDLRRGLAVEVSDGDDGTRDWNHLLQGPA